MALIHPDTSQAWEKLPRGTYDALITGADLDVSRAGNPMLTVDFDLKHDGKMVPRRAYFLITGEEPYMLNMLLEACGFEAWDMSRSFDTNDLIGCEVSVDYDGQWITRYYDR